MTSTLISTLISKANEKNYNFREVTRAIGIPDDVVKNWMKGSAEPTDGEIWKFCDHIEISVSDVKKVKKQKTAVVENREKAETEFMPASVKEERKESEVMNENEVNAEVVEVIPEVKTPEIHSTTVDKPKRTRTSSPKTVGNKKSILSEESEMFVRKTLGLKKGDVLDEKALTESYKSGVTQIKQKLDELTRLEKDITKAFFGATESAPVDERLKKLIAAAEKASDEGIEVAVTILEKFRK